MAGLNGRIAHLEGLAGRGPEPVIGAEAIRQFARGILARDPSDPLLREARAAAEGAETADEYCRRFWQAVIVWVRNGDCKAAQGGDKA